MTGSVVIAEVHALMHVVLSKAEKNTCLMGESVGATITLQTMCRTNRGRYNRVELYLD